MGHEGCAGGGRREAGSSTSGSTGRAVVSEAVSRTSQVETVSAQAPGTALAGLEAGPPSLVSTPHTTAPGSSSARPQGAAISVPPLAGPAPSHTAPTSDPPRPDGRRYRLSSFKERMTPYRPSSSDGDGTEKTSRRRPGMKRRFSRSLTSLLPPRSDDTGDDTGDDEATKLSKWRAKGKAKLIKAFKPPQNSSGSSSRAESPDDAVFRVSSRSRSHSAPLFLPPTVIEYDFPSRRSPPTVAPAPRARLEDDETKDDSPFSSAFNTCPSSPVLDSGFATSTPNPAISTTLDPSSLVFELVAEPEPEPDLFARLPHEVQLRIFRGLLEVCEDEWIKEVKEGRWTGEKASDRWRDGRASGRRELVKMGRVGHSFRFESSPPC